MPRPSRPLARGLRRRRDAGTARRAGDGRQPAGQRRSAPDLRRADAALQPQHLRQPLPLPGQSAQAGALAGAVAHRLGRRPHLGVQAAPGRQVPRRQRDHRRRRRLQLQARAGDRQGAVGRLQAGAQAGQRHGAGQEHGALRARQALRAVPVGDPDRHDRQSARGEGQREQQRLGRGLARLERAPARAPTSSMPRPTARSSAPTSSATTAISSAGATTQGADADPDPADARDLHPRAGAAAGLGRHDRQLSADRPGRAHPEVQGRAHREEHVHARLHPAHEQQEAAASTTSTRASASRTPSTTTASSRRSSRATPSATRRPCPTTSGATPRT